MKHATITGDSVFHRIYFIPDEFAEVVGCFYQKNCKNEYLVKKAVKSEDESWAANIISKIHQIGRSKSIIHQQGSSTHFESYTGKTLQDYNKEHCLYLWILESDMEFKKSNKDMKDSLIRIDD